MKNILIQTKNDRGTEARASTHGDKLAISVYFKVNGGVKKSELVLENKNGLLTIWQDEKAIGLTNGEDSQKLDFCK
jgi:hypothetical protein